MPAIRASTRIRAASERNRPGLIVTGHASVNSRSYNPHTLGLPKAEQLAPSRARSRGGSLVSVAAKDFAHHLPRGVTGRDEGDVVPLGVRLREHVHV